MYILIEYLLFDIFYAQIEIVYINNKFALHFINKTHGELKLFTVIDNNLSKGHRQLNS